MFIKRKKMLSTLLIISLSSILSLILIIALNSILSFCNWQYDVTAEKIHTLSTATKEQVKQIQEPITIRFYCSLDNKNISKNIQNHYKQIIKLFRQYQSLNLSLFHLEILDPTRSLSMKQSADLDKIYPRIYDNMNTWCGLSISSGNKTISIPFIYPEKINSLEYDITRIIRVFNISPSLISKETIGFITNLPIGGREAPPSTSTTQKQAQPLPPWYFLTDISQDSIIVPIDFSQALIPEKYQTIVVIHPQKLTQETLYALDQYLLLGGNLIIYLDPFCTTDAQLNPSSEGVVARLPSESNISLFLKKWGIGYSTLKVVADFNYKTIAYGQHQGFFPTLLSIPKQGLNTNHKATKNLTRLQMILSGAFNLDNVPPNLQATILCETSDKSGLIDRYLAQEMTKTQDQTFDVTNKNNPLIIELSGSFESCYKQKPKSILYNYKHQQTSIKPGKVYLFADADMLYDAYCVETITTQGNPHKFYVNDNIRLLQNIIDLIKNDESMLELRSRDQQKRPLLKLQQLAIEMDKRYGNEIASLTKQISQQNQEIENLKLEITKTEDVINQEKKIKENSDKISDLRQERQKNITKQETLLKEKNTISQRMNTQIKLFNILLMPLIVIFLGCFITCYKWTRRKK